MHLRNIKRKHGASSSVLKKHFIRNKCLLCLCTTHMLDFRKGGGRALQLKLDYYLFIYLIKLFIYLCLGKFHLQSWL